MSDIIRSIWLLVNLAYALRLPPFVEVIEKKRTLQLLHLLLGIKMVSPPGSTDRRAYSSKATGPRHGPPPHNRSIDRCCAAQVSRPTLFQLANRKREITCRSIVIPSRPRPQRFTHRR